MSCSRTVPARKPSPITRIFSPRVIFGATLAASAAAAIVIAPVSPAPAHAATTSSVTAAHRAPTRWVALEWAVRQAGKWYCYGGTGPSCFDCSGLVQQAYRHAGISLPRTTYEMLGSRRLHRIPARYRKPGDLAFYGSGHVELVTPRGTFGALHTGTRIGWHFPNPWWYPTMYFEVR